MAEEGRSFPDPTSGEFTNVDGPDGFVQSGAKVPPGMDPVVLESMQATGAVRAPVMSPAHTIASAPEHLGPGLRVRLTALRGETPRGILTRRLYLPAVLNEVTLEESADHVEFTTHAHGEFSVPAQGGPQARRLRDLPFEFLTLDWAADWLVQWRHPQVVQDELEAVLRSKRPVLLLAILRFGDGRPEEYRGPVTLRRTARTLKPGETDTRYWTLEFKEYRPLRAARLSTKSGKRAAHLPARFKLTNDTTLEWLSKHFFGTTRYWLAIARHNGIKKWGQTTPLVKHSRFKVGDYIKIPEITRGVSGGGG